MHTDLVLESVVVHFLAWTMYALSPRFVLVLGLTFWKRLSLNSVFGSAAKAWVFLMTALSAWICAFVILMPTGPFDYDL